MPNKKIIVIGAGISGLTTAYNLMKAGADVKVFEKTDHVGGNIQTEKVGKELLQGDFDGFIFEKGPNSGLETTLLIQELCESLGIAERKIYANEKAAKRYILRFGKLHELAMSPKFLFSKLFSAKAKIRLIKEPFIRSKSHPKETLAEFTKRRLGEEFLDYAINPFVAGVFAGDPNDLNVMTAFPKLYELEQNYGSLIGGSIKSARERKKRAEQSKQSARTFSFIDGMHELTDALELALKNNIHKSCEAVKIEKKSIGYSVTYNNNGNIYSAESDAVILSVPSYAASSLIKDLDENLSSALSDVYYPPVNVVFMVYKKENIGFNIDGFGYLIPAKENRKILGSLWNSSIFDKRAPEGYITLTNFIGGARSPQLTELNDADTLKMVKDDLRTVLDLKDEPELNRIVRWKKAIPQYHKNYDEVFAAIENFHSVNPGFLLCSNYYKGISIGDCIKSAYNTSEILKKN